MIRSSDSIGCFKNFRYWTHQSPISGAKKHLFYVRGFTQEGAVFLTSRYAEHHFGLRCARVEGGASFPRALKPIGTNKARYASSSPSLAAAIVTEVRLLRPSVFCNRVGGAFLVAPKHELPIREHSGLRVALGLEIVVLRLSANHRFPPAPNLLAIAGVEG